VTATMPQDINSVGPSATGGLFYFLLGGDLWYHKTLDCEAVPNKAGYSLDIAEELDKGYTACTRCITATPPDLTIQPMPTEVTCPRCYTNEGRYTRSGPHVKLECSQCGSYVKFVSKITLAPELVGLLFEEEE